MSDPDWSLPMNRAELVVMCERYAEADSLIRRVNVQWVHRDRLAFDIGAYIARTGVPAEISAQKEPQS